MNTKNNMRRQRTREQIQKVFMELLKTRELDRITVSEICHQTGFNRSTFYANYLDIYDLADTVRLELEREVEHLYGSEGSSAYHRDDWLRLLYHIRENQVIYNTYFKLGYDSGKIDITRISGYGLVFAPEHMHYHVEFFRAGFNAMVKLWLRDGCRESPEEISGILRSEYRGRKE